ITLSGGWGGVFGFVGTLGVSFNNFSVRKAIGLKTFPPMGDGQRLSLNGQANGRRYQSYSFSFSEPWLGGRKPNSFGVSYTNSIQRQIDYRTNEMYGWMKLSGITLTLGRRVKWPDDFFVVSNSIGYLQYNIYNFPRFAFSKGISNSVTLNTTIARRSSDNPMYPTRGSDVTLSSNLTPPYSLFNSINYETATNEEKYKWIEYHKWNFDAKYYLPLTEKLVLAPRLHFGFIGTYSRRAQAGPFERFILGGSGLTAGQGQNYLLGSDVVGLRGYPDPDPYSSGESSVTPYDDVNKIIGGTMFTKYVLELRYPVSLAPTATIYLLTYVEAGNNVNNFSQYNPYDLKRSAGVGARIFMPAFGLLGLDWGYGFDPVFGGTGPAGTQFHFSIGQQIR
ncbi:MAG: BamA/TamA family outer membrane protein, partial [Cyclobacteriaceae bacterium]|nr:BamA/TamA family outer membrane protein [Cyclobacteriaceae bacterium]